VRSIQAYNVEAWESQNVFVKNLKWTTCLGGLLALRLLYTGLAVAVIVVLLPVEMNTTWGDQGASGGRSKTSLPLRGFSPRLVARLEVADFR
jgi:hypothetical protein